MIALLDCSCARDRQGILSKFLSESPLNSVLVTDAFLTESLKGDPLHNIRTTLRTLERFSSRVLVCRPLAELHAGQFSGVEQLVDYAQTSSFGDFCSQVRRADDGDAHLRAAVRERGRWASGLVDSISSRVSILRDNAARLQHCMSPNEREEFRKRGHLADPSVGELFLDLSAVARAFGFTAPRTDPRSKFAFRMALSLLVRQYHQAGRGLGTSRSAPQTVNDFFDSIHIAAATYCNSFLTLDAESATCYAETLRLLASSDPRAPWAQLGPA